MTEKLFLIRTLRVGWRIAVRRSIRRERWWFEQIGGAAICAVGEEDLFLPLSEIERLETQFHIGTSQSWK